MSKNKDNTSGSFGNVAKRPRGRPLNRELADPSKRAVAEVNRTDALFRARLPKIELAEIKAYLEANGITNQELVRRAFANRHILFKPK